MEQHGNNISERDFVIFNSLFLLLNFTANTFYAFCLILSPCSGQRLKQPLKLLLGLLVWSSLTYCVALQLLCFFWKNTNYSGFFVVWLVGVYCVHNSTTFYVWLNFYYFMQIVPAQRALLVWVRRNIAAVIYSALLFDQVVALLCGGTVAANIILWRAKTVNITQSSFYCNELQLPNQIAFICSQLNFLICLGVMSLSSFSTVSYLNRHMRSVSKRGTFSTLRFQSQMRVTISGIFQGVLYLLYGLFFLYESLTFWYIQDLSLGFYISFIVFTLYISCTTVSLGISQSVFRERAADIGKAFKELCSAVTDTNDVALRSSQVTVNTLTVDVQI